MQKLIDSTNFVNNYKFLEGYDDLVKSSDGKIYNVNYKGMNVELLEVSNEIALNKIENGLAQFVNMLKKDLGIS